MAQTAKAVLYSDSGGCVTEEITAPAAGEHGDVIQTADGKAAVVLGADAASSSFASGDRITVAKTGQFTVLKTASVVLLTGGRTYWDRSAEKANFETASGDFYLGRVVADAASAAATVVIDLNVMPTYQIELHKGQWTVAATNGLSVTRVAQGGSTLKLAFDAVSEAAMAALYSVDTIPVADLGIFEAKVAVYDIGDNAALDINIGIANGTHATDFDSVTEAVVFHLDGTALDIALESDDGTTEVNATDTTVDAVDDTFFEVWIDCRNIDDIQCYVDAVLVLGASTFKLDAATGPMLAIAHIEKTSDDTPADVRVEFMTIRSTDIAS
jgi:predicted RecA/RadA family phage recombinase